jgi:hypothetical protein
MPDVNLSIHPARAIVGKAAAFHWRRDPALNATTKTRCSMAAIREKAYRGNRQVRAFVRQALMLIPDVE